MTAPLIIDADIWKPLATSDSFSKDLLQEFDLKRVLFLSNQDVGQDKEYDIVQQKVTKSVNESMDDVIVDDKASSSLTDDPTAAVQYRFLNDLPPLLPTESSNAAFIGRSHNSMEASIRSHNENGTDHRTMKQQPSHRKLLHKSSQFFRKRIMKIKTSHYYQQQQQQYPIKESSGSSTITTTNSSVAEPAMVLQFPPRPLQYSSEIHPPSDNDAKRRSLPTFKSDNKQRKQKQRPKSYQPENNNNKNNNNKRRSSFIIRTFLR